MAQPSFTLSFPPRLYISLHLIKPPYLTKLLHSSSVQPFKRILRNGTLNMPDYICLNGNPEDIGFFDPHYKDTGPVVSHEDVHAFVDRLKCSAAFRGLEELRTVLPQCFRGAALKWYLIE